MNWVWTQAGLRGPDPRSAPLPWVLSEGYLCLFVAVDDDDTDEALVCVATKIVFFFFFFLFYRKCASFSSHTLKTTSKASFPSEGVKLGTHTELFYISFYHLAAVCDITCGKSDWRIKGRSKHTEPWLTGCGKVTVFHWDAGIIMEFVI